MNQLERAIALARSVKIADIRDNLDVTRLAALDAGDLARVAKYHKALRYLLDVDAGSPHG